MTSSYYRASRGLLARHGQPCHLVLSRGLLALVRFTDGTMLATGLSDVLPSPPKQEPKKEWKLPVCDRPPRGRVGLVWPVASERRVAA